ncbi:MAG TPA: hypothetical protein VJP80_06445 [Candidatus Saccharimonadales bacterium]|nr:hypothetical protein [Candidatus Saccharimonadales bacterium]
MGLNWESFNAIHGKNANDEFEVLAGMLVEWIEKGLITNVPTNYKGIESEPFENKSGKKVAYQSKFSSTASEKSLDSEFMSSLKKLTKQEVEKFEILYLVSNKFGPTAQKKLKTKVLAQFSKLKAKQPEIKFISGINRFKTDLLTVKEFENARAYFFGGGNPRGLVEANVSKASRKVITNTFVELEMNDASKSFGSESLLSRILESKNPNVLIMAAAGTGKSLLLQKLAYDFDALGKDYGEAMQAILKHGIVIFLKASLYKGRSINGVVNTKLENFGLKFTDYPITLIVDGLDELSFDDSTNMINELQDMSSSKIIKKCITSVRAASSSAIRCQQVMSPYSVSILSLTEDKMVEYFEKKRDKKKTRVLKQIIKNKQDTAAIKDMRLLELFWINVHKGVAPDKAEILSAAFVEHIGQRADELNLLKPKDQSLKLILESLSTETLVHGGRTISLSSLQNAILAKHERLSYNDVNEIVERLANICGENGDFGQGEDFTFEHKSWIDYFSALYLTRKFKLEKSALLELIDYEDMLANWFVPVARYEYRERNLLPEAIAVGIIESYLGFESDRTDETEEQVFKIQLSVNDDALRETVLLQAEELLASGVVTSPRINYEYLKAGYRDIAEKMHRRFCEGLSRRKDESINRTYWDNFSYFYMLQVEFATVAPSEILKRFNRVIGQYSSASNWDIHRKLEPTISMTYGRLMDMGVGIDEIINGMDAEVLKLSLGFIYLPETIRQILRNNNAQTSLTKLVATAQLDDIDRYSLMSLLGLSFKDEEEAAKEVLQELSDNFNTHFDDVNKYHVRLYLLRKAFGWIIGADETIENHHFVLLQDVFDLLFNFATEQDLRSDFATMYSRLVQLTDSATTFSINRDNACRRAITYLVAALAEKLTIQNTRKIVDLSESGSLKPIFYSVLLEDIFARDRALFGKLFKLDDVEKIVASKEGDLESYSAELRSKAALIAFSDPSKAPGLLNELRRLTRLRYGYHKDILGFFLPTALKVTLEKDYFSREQKEAYTEKIYSIILNIQDVTDGDEVAWLPDEFFKVLIAYDYDLALEYYERYSKQTYDMPIIEQIILARVERGEDFKDIKRYIGSYRREHRTQDEIFESYFEARFTVFVYVAANALYSKETRVEALRLASQEIGELKKQDKDYRESTYERGQFLNDAIAKYRKLVKILLPNESLENIKRPKRYQQPDLGPKPKNAQFADYEKREQKAKDNFAKIEDEATYKRIIKDMSNNRFSRYDSKIVSSKQNVNRFVNAVTKHQEPLASFSSLLIGCLDFYSYRAESEYFVDRIWNSPHYRHQFIELLFNRPHHQDTNLLLRVWAANNERELVVGLINQVVDCIKLLSRKD